MLSAVIHTSFRGLSHGVRPCARRAQVFALFAEVLTSQVQLDLQGWHQRCQLLQMPAVKRELLFHFSNGSAVNLSKLPADKLHIPSVDVM